MIRFCCDLIKEAKGDSNRLWTAVNEASSRTIKSSSPQYIIADEADYTSPRSIASALNSHFASIGKILADKIRPVAPVSMSVANHSGSFISIKETSEAVVLKQLQSLKTDKAIGLDNISARLLKCGAQQLVFPLRSYLIYLFVQGNSLGFGSALRCQPCLNQ